MTPRRKRLLGVLAVLCGVGLATAVAIAAYEGLRQVGGPGAVGASPRGA